MGVIEIRQEERVIMYENKYHSTGQFRNAVKHLKNCMSFDGFNDDGSVKSDYSKIKPVVYRGTVKLHGTNASIVVHEDESITFHSKERLLGTLEGGELCLLGDNSEFAQTMYRRKKDLTTLIDSVRDNILNSTDISYPLKISGEWCGPSVQRGVGVSGIDKKSLFIFGVKSGDNWIDISGIKSLPEAGLYNINDFPTYEVVLDPNFPDKSVIEMTKIVEDVENECPVAKSLGVEGELVGEGVVWTPLDQELRNDTGTWFKTKGQKHSVSKVKKLVSVDPEKVANVEKFIEYACTDNRLRQGVGEVGLDIITVGTFIGWVNKDINKEEGDVLEASNLSMKDVGGMIANKARHFYLTELNKNI